MEVLVGGDDFDCYLGMATLAVGFFGGVGAILSGPAAPFVGMAAGVTYGMGVAMISRNCDFSR